MGEKLTQAELDAMRAEGLIEPGRTVSEELVAGLRKARELAAAAGVLILPNRKEKQ